MSQKYDFSRESEGKSSDVEAKFYFDVLAVF